MCTCADERRFLGVWLSLPMVKSACSCLLNSFCSAGPWLVDVDGELEGGADRDDTECCSWDVGTGSITSCLGVDALAEAAIVVVKSSKPTHLIFFAFLYTLFFLLSLLCGEVIPHVFIAWAVDNNPSDAAKSCAAICSFSSTDSTGLFFGDMLTLCNRYESLEWQCAFTTAIGQRPLLCDDQMTFASQPLKTLKLPN